jgi:glycerophosphoryl diester phosphodiesterase
MNARPSVIAHRGASREQPENSIPAFLRALELGADGIELDVHATRDRVVVVHHDDSVAPRESDGTGERTAIASLSVAELAMHTLAHGVPIPTLSAVLDAVGDRATVFVEVKASGIEQDVVSVIERSRARCAVHSFDHRVVLRVRTLSPSLRTGILLASYLIDPAAALHAAQAHDCWQAAEFVDAELVERIRGAGGDVIAWTVNDVDRAHQLVSLGVSGICTDRPREMRALYADTGP